jgi:hypothetical protein
MTQERTDEPSRPFDVFELLTAILLGLAAIGASVASLQGGQWGGKQLEAFAEANTLTTKAAKQYNEDTVLMNADYAAVALAKQHILEARDARDPQAKDRHFTLASYFLMNQLTHGAYKALELPQEFYVEDEAEAETKPVAGAAAVAPPAKVPAVATTAAPGEEGEDEAEDEPAVGTLAKDIPDERLLAMLSVELDEAYVDEMLAEGEAMFKQADTKFQEGRQANENGDQFDLAGVFFTVALFFAGLGLVFKTSMRWGFLGLGALVFAGSVVFMARLPWA